MIIISNLYDFTFILKGIDFIAINYKRVAEVWMDEYKEYFYKRDPERYAKTEIGYSYVGFLL